MESKEAYLSLLKRRKELVFKFLRMTNDTVFTDEGIAQNAEKYIALVEDREEIIDELKELDGEFERIDSCESEEIALLNQEIAEMADQIARLEVDRSKKASDIISNLQRGIKDIRISKKVNDAYEHGSLSSTDV